MSEAKTRLVAVTAEQAEEFNDLRIWIEAEARRVGSKDAPAPVWQRHADNIEALFKGWENAAPDE